jgi:hypothetical protein
MRWLDTYKIKLKQKPMKISLVTVSILFGIKILFSAISGLMHADHLSYMLSFIFESIVFDLIYRFFFWFIIGAGLYEWGMHLKNSGKAKTIKRRTMFYILLGVIATAIASWHAILPLIALFLLAYLSYLTGRGK